MMDLNTLKPAKGAKAKAIRVGRGIGSGFGKTCGRGHKGQHARSGGYHKVGFEGGQMPLQRRIPKLGFASRRQLQSAQVNLSELNKMSAEQIDLQALKDAGVVSKNTKFAKVYLAGKIERAVTLVGIKATKGAREQIEAAGGKIEE